MLSLFIHTEIDADWTRYFLTQTGDGPKGQEYHEEYVETTEDIHFHRNACRNLLSAVSVYEAPGSFVSNWDHELQCIKRDDHARTLPPSLEGVAAHIRYVVAHDEDAVPNDRYNDAALTWSGWYGTFLSRCKQFDDAVLLVNTI